MTWRRINSSCLEPDCAEHLVSTTSSCYQQAKTRQDKASDKSCLQLKNSLAGALLKRPNFSSNPHGLFFRLRKYNVAITAEKEAMLMQVVVKDKKEDAQNLQQKTSK